MRDTVGQRRTSKLELENPDFKKLLKIEKVIEENVAESDSWSSENEKYLNPNYELEQNTKRW